MTVQKTEPERPIRCPFCDTTWETMLDQAQHIHDAHEEWLV